LRVERARVVAFLSSGVGVPAISPARSGI
jgi:hypothetical protein